jgi:hypothetical protein
MTTAKNIAWKLLAAIGAGAILAGVFFAGAALAPSLYADSTLDPHIPNPMIGWCPGGGAGGMFGYGFCDGTRYADGSYWHVIRGNVPFAGPQMRMDCVIDSGSPVPPLGPPGGCGGAVH